MPIDATPDQLIGLEFGGGLQAPDLVDALGIFVGAKTMAIEANGSRFEPIIGNPGDGSSPHCAIIDEYHEHDSDSMFDTMRTKRSSKVFRFNRPVSESRSL